MGRAGGDIDDVRMSAAQTLRWRSTLGDGSGGDDYLVVATIAPKIDHTHGFASPGRFLVCARSEAVMTADHAGPGSSVKKRLRQYYSTWTLGNWA